MKHNLKLARKKTGMTQREVSDKTGIPLGTLRRWEQGVNEPDIEAIIALAELYQTSTDELLGSHYAPFPTVPIKAVPTATVPLVALTRVHAGPMTDEEGLERCIEVPQSVLDRHPNCQASIVEGDCMDKFCPDGMAVLWDADIEPQNGSVVIVETEDYQAVMRRWYKGAGTLMLVADSHSEHPDIVLTEEDGPIRVVGTVFWAQTPEEVE